MTSTPRALASIPRSLKISNNEDISTRNQELIFSKIGDIDPCRRMKWKQRLYLGVEPAASFETVTSVCSPGPPAYQLIPQTLQIWKQMVSLITRAFPHKLLELNIGTYMYTRIITTSNCGVCQMTWQPQYSLLSFCFTSVHQHRLPSGTSKLHLYSCTWIPLCPSLTDSFLALIML